MQIKKLAMTKDTRTAAPVNRAATKARLAPNARELPLADVAYAKIKAAIVHGELPPGLQAVEQHIAAQLQVSRTPVHQAIIRLEQEGWVRLVPRKGLVILPLSAEEMGHVYEVLMGLEGLAVTRLASRAVDVDDGIDASLVAAAEAGEQALVNDDLLGWANADDRFHTLLVDCSGNPHLSRLARTVREQAQRARLLTNRLRPKPTASNADHQAILAAIRARQPERARAALETHRLRGMATLLPILETLARQPRILSA
jgi:DNA-binding GntR family transcriptional regulator